jgi:hypothetical protein
MNFLPASSAQACHPIRWEQQVSGGNCQMNLLPAQCFVFSTNKMGVIGIGMQMPGHLVADTMCSDMPVSNKMLVARINDI